MVLAVTETAIAVANTVSTTKSVSVRPHRRVTVIVPVLRAKRVSTDHAARLAKYVALPVVVRLANTVPAANACLTAPLVVALA